MKQLLCVINYKYLPCITRKETVKYHGNIYTDILTENEKHHTLDSSVFIQP